MITDQHHYFKLSPLSNRATKLCTLSSKGTKNRLAAGLRPDPLRERTELPQTPGEEEGMEGKEGEGRERGVRGKKRCERGKIGCL